MSALSLTTPWDVRAFQRGAAFATGLFVLAVLVTAATDEGGLLWSERVARVVPLAPICTALATALALAGPLRRAEARALAGLGRDPFSNAVAAAAGAALVGLVAALVVGFDLHVPVQPFFPRVPAAGSYTFDDDAFVNLRTGWRIGADGTIDRSTPITNLPADPAAALPRWARLSASLVTGVGSVGFAMTVGRLLERRGAAALVLLGVAVLTTFCLQGAAAGRLDARWAPLPTTVLLLGVAWAIVRDRWETSRR